MRHRGFFTKLRVLSLLNQTEYRLSPSLDSFEVVSPPVGAPKGSPPLGAPKGSFFISDPPPTEPEPPNGSEELPKGSFSPNGSFFSPNGSDEEPKGSLSS